MAFAVKNEQNNRPYNSNRGPKKENNRPFCTHCNYHGYTIEKCYKIHGYPPSFRQKSKSSYSQYSGPQSQYHGTQSQYTSSHGAKVNQVSSQHHGVDNSNQVVVTDNLGEGNSAHLFNSLNSN